MTEAERIHEVETYIKRWRRLKDKAADVEEEAAALAFAHGDGGPVQSSSISDKTYRGAELLAANENLVAWVDTIETGMAWLEKERADLFNLIKGHYGMKYTRGYRRKYAKYFMDSYRRVYSIAPTTYHEMRKEALRELSAFAIQNGLQTMARTYQRPQRKSI